MSDECKKAYLNIEREIDAARRLPRNVFRAQWGRFYLFDPDWMFEGAFVPKVSSLLDIEGAQCACIVNLDLDKGVDNCASKFLIDRHSTKDEFQNLLRGTNANDGWVYNMDRFGCVSEKALWCIYCERPSELAVLGIKQGMQYETYGPVLESLCAGRVSDVANGVAAYEFCSHSLSREWQEEILKEYGV